MKYNVIKYLYSKPSRYLLKGAFCAVLYDVKYHHKQKCSIN